MQLGDDLGRGPEPREDEIRIASGKDANETPKHSGLVSLDVEPDRFRKRKVLVVRSRASCRTSRRRRIVDDVAWRVRSDLLRRR